MISPKESLHDLLGYDGLKIYQRDDMLAFSLDSSILADFVHIGKRVTKIIDFGTGNGPIPLMLSLKTEVPIIGVEIQPDVAELARRSVALNHLEHQIEILDADIKTLHERFESGSIGLITCNPPFFKYIESSSINQTDYLTIARHEVAIDLESIIVSAKRLLSTNGSLHIIHRVERLQELLVLFSKHRFYVKRMRFVYPKPGIDALSVLIEARNNANPGNLRMLEPLYVLDTAGQYTPEILKIFRMGKK